MRKVTPPPPCLSVPLSPLPLLSFPLLSPPPLLFLSSPALPPLSGLSVDLRQQVWQKPRLSRKTRGLKAHKFHAVQHANVPSADKRAFNPAALLLSTPLPLSLLPFCHSTSLSYSLILFFPSLFVFCDDCVTLYCINPILFLSLLVYSISSILFYFHLSWFILFYYTLFAVFCILNPPPVSPPAAPPWHLPPLLLTGPCALWSSWRCPSTAATGPTWHPPRLVPTWLRSWRSTPRCPSIMQALTLKCSGSACLLQRCPPAKPHPKPSKVREEMSFVWFWLGF